MIESNMERLWEFVCLCVHKRVAEVRVWEGEKHTYREILTVCVWICERFWELETNTMLVSELSYQSKHKFNPD